ncbi:hypothetical protein ATY81_27320 [Rhizobium sp. R72]|uniref:hypothetical protein n=1 Tax=unclassified Rhizobium TaxID=2613769 RepID=UPI000B52CB34|nr:MULTISPECIES: hypothetical protein [unclassified Rhizobium]OWV98107.1 hypothetical protein ATY81_27320 [Rhizobium sp. R72]OWV98132.1 hypothetical protein ATY80_27320 [Rhizobium sp. R711]
MYLYAKQIVRGYIDGKEKFYMVTDAVYELRMCARDNRAIDTIEHALEMEDEGIRLDLMGRALKILESS